MNVLPLKSGVIYGPVDSRRLGRSLGINLSPINSKLCSFNCVYCHYGWTERITKDATKYIEDFPKKEAVLSTLRGELTSIAKPEYITFSGNGEPTLHPEFESIVSGVKMIRDELSPGTPLALLSNTSMFNSASVKRALSMIDVKIVKLDAGREETFQQMNKPVEGVSLKDIIESLKNEKEFIVQTIFIKGSIDNTEESNLSEWISILSSILPEKVQVYSTDRPVPKVGIVKVEREELEKIAERVEEKTGIPVEVFSVRDRESYERN